MKTLTLARNKLNAIKSMTLLAACGYSTSAYCAFIEEVESGFDKVDAAMVGKIVGLALVGGFGWGAYDAISEGTVKRGLSLGALGLGSGAIANHLIETFFGG